MKRYKLLLSAALLVLAAASQALAQTPPAPPNVIVIVREDIKPGKMPAHAEEAMMFVRTQAKANTMLNENMRDYRIAMSPIAGNENEVTYLWAYGSFEEMEKKRKEADRLANGPMKADFDALVDRDLHAAQADVIASLRSDLSYGLGNVDVAQARYMAVTTLRIKPGHEEEYWNGMKKYVYPARDKTALKSGSWAVFGVRAGMPGTSYVIIRPIKSLAEFDAATPRTARDAMSAEDRMEMDKITDRSVTFTITNFHIIDPRLSLVSPAFAARDTTSPAFWNPTLATPAPTTAAAGAKPANK